MFQAFIRHGNETWCHQYRTTCAWPTFCLSAHTEARSPERYSWEISQVKRQENMSLVALRTFHYQNRTSREVGAKKGKIMQSCQLTLPDSAETCSSLKIYQSFLSPEDESEYTVWNIRTTMALFRANTPTKEIYSWLYLQVYYLFTVSSNPFMSWRISLKILKSELKFSQVRYFMHMLRYSKWEDWSLTITNSVRCL